MTPEKTDPAQMGRLLISKGSAAPIAVTGILIVGVAIFSLLIFLIVSGKVALFSLPSIALFFIGISMIAALSAGTSTKIECYDQGIKLSESGKAISLPYGEVVCVRFSSIANYSHGIKTDTESYFELVPRVEKSFTEFHNKLRKSARASPSSRPER